jgi:hypothetical protein
MKYVFTIFTVVFLITVTSTSTAQKIGRHTLEEWQTIIDTHWGEGASTETKLAIFDNVYNIIDNNFASFQGLPENILDSLTQIYRPEIEAGVSKGRFVAIMNHFAMAFKESHLWVFNESVNFNTPLIKGVPFYVLGAWTDNSHFGATLTPLPDSTLLVIKTLPDHPLGLIPGDLVLGYDGIPWEVLYKKLLVAEFPLFAGIPYCTFEKAFTHDMLKNAGMNWHLFDTLDVVKYNSGDTLHYPTSLLDGQNGNIAGNEQLAIPGVPFPDINWQGVFDFDIWNLKNYVGWGIINDTNIGYIYVYAWFTPGQAPGSSISGEFYKAVDSLMNYYKVNGLIFDDRFCFGGGQFDTEDKGFSLLFNSYIETIAFDERCSTGNHFNMCVHPSWNASKVAISGNPNTFFDKPIAVLTGPGAVSYGDIIPLKMTFHPMARLFGKSTSGAFSAVEQLRHPGTGWDMWNADANAYLVSNPGNYLSRTESHVDEEVWLTQEDVAKGEDTVVKRAMEWIQNLVHAHDVTVDKTYIKPGIDSVGITAKVENPNQHNLSVEAVVRNMDSTITDNFNLFDDGMHGDGEANDNLCGNLYQPTDEQLFRVSVTTNDNSEETSRTLPNVAWFTTIGPVEFDSYQITDILYQTIYQIKLSLRNKGLSAMAPGITAELSSSDTNVTNISPLNNDPIDIPAGQAIETEQIFNIGTNGNPANVLIHIDLYSNGYHYWSDSLNFLVTIITVSKDNLPKKYSLSQNYPNPFNPSTKIKFDLPNPEIVKIEVYNIIGQKIETLLNKPMSAGYHEVEFNGQNLSSGVYLYRIEVADPARRTRAWHDVKKMILLH